MSIFFRYSLAGVMVGIGGTVLVACGRPAVQAPPPPVVASVVRVEPLPIEVPISYSGQTNGSLQVEVRARVSGILLKRSYTEGHAVKAGDTLFLIDPAPYQAALDKARAGLEVQLSQLVRARADLNRVQPLFQQNAVSQKDLDDALTSYAAAKAAVAAAAADVEQARINLGYTRVTAPIAGLTSMEVPSEGSLVTPSGDSSKLTSIARIDPLYVNFTFTDRELLKLKRERAAGKVALQRDQLKVFIRLGDGSYYPRAGKIDFTDNEVDATTGTIRVRAVLPNPEGEVLPGEFVRVYVQGITRLNAIRVPQRAVVTTPQGKQVWTLDSGNRVALRAIEGSDEVGTDLVVDSGLSKGDRVVIDSLGKLRAGIEVKPEVVALPPLPGGAGATHS